MDTHERLAQARRDFASGKMGTLAGSVQQGEPTMMLDWNDYQKQLIAALSPDTVRGYRTLGEAGAKTGTLDAKTRELISLAVAVSLRCDGCITTHTGAAIKAGASKEEIAEALGVASNGALLFSLRSYPGSSPSGRGATTLRSQRMRVRLAATSRHPTLASASTAPLNWRHS
jgi:AhpD family alkylhydroperoxidase